MLFADLLSLHLNTFLTFFSLVDIIIVTALECIQHYPLQDRHHVILSSHAGCMARDLISIVSMHSFKPYIHMHHMLTHTHNYTPDLSRYHMGGLYYRKHVANLASLWMY